MRGTRSGPEAMFTRTDSALHPSCGEGEVEAGEVPGPDAVERVAVPPGVETEQVQRDRGEGVFEVCLERAAVAGVRSRGEMPDSERRLRRQLVKAKELRAQALAEVDRLKADNEALVGALHQVVMENRQLRLRLTEQPSNVHVLPTQPRPLFREEPPCPVLTTNACPSTPKRT